MKLNLEERIFVFSNYVKAAYGKRTYRIGLSTGVTCPHRVKNGGCIFCNPHTFTGEYQNQGLTIKQQLDNAIPRIKKSCGDVALIAYFQDETSTAGDIGTLKQQFSKALEHPEIVALTVSTRPDYVNPDVLDMLASFHIPVTIELGMQSIHDNSLDFLNRGHDFAATQKALQLCESAGIRTGVHLILGIPGETRDMMKQTIDYISQKSNIAEVKFHNLVVYEHTTLNILYEKNKLHIPDLDEYIELLANLLRSLRGDIVVSRLFTSNVRRSGIALNAFPGNKTKWMNQLRLFMIEHEIIQGDQTNVIFDPRKIKEFL